MANIKSYLWSAVARAIWLSAVSSSAHAQQPATGFAIERFSPAPPGSGWFVMDDLNISGGLGGAIELSSGYARNPLVVPGSAALPGFPLVSDEAFVNIGAAVTLNRYRLYFDLPVPYLVSGSSGTFGAYALSAPAVTPGTNPDTVADPRLGFDARLLGAPDSSLRLGGSAELIFPSGARSEYTSDARYRGDFRLLAAGDYRAWSYAGHLGVQLRPLVDNAVPGGPDGSEFHFGVSGGHKTNLNQTWALVVGPEVFGETALRAFFNGDTGIEGLMTARFERSGQGRNLRVRIGIGHGIVQHFGAPEWRVLAAVEIFGHHRNAGK